MSQAKDYRIEMLEPGGTIEGYVSHVTDPDNFYIQLSSSTTTLENIASALEDIYQAKAPENRLWHLGEMCAAMYEDQWSRGRITGTPHNKDRVEVTFVDYGNKEYVLKNSIHLLSPEMLTTPVQSFHCCLEGVSSAESFWSPEKVAQLEDFLLDKELTIKIVAYDECQDAYRVLLYDEKGGLLNQQFAAVSGSEFHASGPATNGVDQKMGATSASQVKPSRGIAQALGVNVAGRKLPISNLMMKVGDKEKVSVAYVSSPTEFWCNLCKYLEACEQMAEDMATKYSAMGPSDGILHNLRPGSVCAVYQETDGIWYRAAIEKVMGPKASVFFVDYGNLDVVAVGNVKELKEEFRALPAQAIKCSLQGVVSSSGHWTDQASDLFEKLVMDKDYTATVLEKDDEGKHYLTLIDCSDNSNVATAFTRECPEAVKGSPNKTSSVVKADLPRLPALNIQLQRKAEVFVVWVTTPGDFFIQLADNQTMLDTMSDNLQDFYGGSQSKPMTCVQVGSIVAAKFSEDEMWYRAVVSQVTGTSCEVEFVDFGNTDKVACSSLQQLEKQFSSVPAMAVRCSLANVRPLSQGNTWSGDAKEFLESLTEKGAVCTFLNRKGDTYEVDLQAEGKNIAKEMVALAVVREASPDASASGPKFQSYRFVQPGRGQPLKAYVAFVESVESFHMQLASNMNDLEQLMEELQQFYESGKGKPISSFTVGLPCAAKYEEDGLWYRAQVRSFTARDVDVFFVDYGNTQSSAKNAVMTMDSNFVTKMEAQAIHCHLDINESRNPNALLEKFNAFTGEEEEVELVIKSKEGSKFIVDLLKGGASVTEELKGGQTPRGAAEKSKSAYTPGEVSPGQTVSAFASYIESPARFWVQLAGCDDELTSMMETLSAHYGSGKEPALPNPSPGQPCVALYDEDKQWYRASIISVHGTVAKVQFVDYGNLELVDRQNIKSISGIFMSSPLLAIECCLEGFQSSPTSDDAVLVMESLMTEQELAVTFRGPKNVSVKAGDKDVAQVLREKCAGPPSQKILPSSNSKSPPSQSSAKVKSPVSQTSPHSANSSFGSSDTRMSSSPKGTMCAKFKEAMPPSGSAEAIITHVNEGSGLFYIQLTSSESQLQQLSSKLQSEYASGGPALQGPPSAGMACCAKFSVDNCWYRALVEKLSGSKAQVQFVDYGNSDQIQTNGLRAATPDILLPPKHAFPCKLKGLNSWTSQTCQTFSKCAVDEQLSVRFVTSSPPFEIQVSIRGQDLLQMLKSPPSPPKPKFEPKPTNSREPRQLDQRQTKSQPPRDNKFGSSQPNQFKGKPDQRSFDSPRSDSWDDEPKAMSKSAKSGDSWDEEPKAMSKSPKSAGSWDDEPKAMSKSPKFGATSPVKTVKQVFQPQVSPAGEQAAYVSHVAEDGTFFVQLLKDVDAIDEMTSKVEKCAAGQHPSPTVGAACGAKFSEDGEWYRGIIKSVSGTSVQVMFVDFGNGEMFEVKTLKPLPADLLTPPLAFQCQVEGVGLLTTEQQTAFRSVSEDKEYLVTLKQGSPYNVIIKDQDGTNLADTVFRPTSIRLPKIPTGTVHAVVSHVGQDGVFYLQLNKELDELADFSEEVQTACEGQTEKLTCFDQGQVCCAKFSEDEAWYRASVLSIAEEKVTVFFVDFGNTDIVSKDELLVVPRSLMSRPSFAFECKIPGVKKWKESQRQKFKTMTDGKTMNASFLSSKQPYEVELTRNISLELEEDESIDESRDEETNIAEKEKTVTESTDGKNTVEEVVQNAEKKPAQDNSTEDSVEKEEHFEDVMESSEEPESKGVEKLVESDSEGIDRSVEPESQDVEKSEEPENQDMEDNANGVKVSEVAKSEETSGLKAEPAESPASEEENFSDAKEDPEDSAPSTPVYKIPTFPAQDPPALDACIVSHLNPDGTFYLQLVSEDDNREALSDKLQDECESSDCQVVAKPSLNMACCAKFSEDEAWYRASVQKLDGDMVEVLFVDFGNTDNIPTSDLKELSPESLQVPPLAYKCVLQDCDVDLVSSKLEEATVDQVLTVTFSTTDTFPCTVNLQLENGTNVSTLLTSSDHSLSVSASTEAKSTEDRNMSNNTKERKCVDLALGQRLQVVISHVVSPSLFYVQSNNLSQLEEMADAMFEHFSSLAEGDGVIENVTVNQLCANKFGEDESWYRAIVQKLDAEADTCDLFYVDYGNSETVPKSSVRELLAEFETLPWQCVSCRLAGVSCQQDWSEEVNTAFDDLVTGKTVTADILSGDGVDQPYLLHLLDLGKSVADSLLALDLPGLEAAEVPSLSAVKHSFNTTDTSTHDLDIPSLDNPSEEAVESGLDEKESTEKDMVDDFDESEQEFSRHLHACQAQETVDDVEESEQEFSRQLQACTAKMESTMMEEVRAARKNAASNQDPSTRVGEKGEEDDEEDDDFEDAVEAEQNSAEEDVDVSEIQVAYSCVSDGLAELDWLDIHVCVAVCASEFWCQLPSARSILSGTTLGIERARASEVVKDAKVGNLYLVCDPPQTNYRGKVLSDCGDDGRVLVLKLDYGTEERVPSKCLFPLVKNQLELPAQAFCCCLDQSESVTASQDWLDNLITQGEAVDRDLQVKIVGRKADGTLLVDVRLKPSEGDSNSGEADNPENADDECKQDGGSEMCLESLEMSQPVLQSTILGDTLSQSRMEKSEGDKEYSTQTLEDNKEYEVTVSGGWRPDSFHVVLQSAKGILEALADDIEAEVKERTESMTEGESLSVNAPCLVYDDAQSVWCRGQVKSVDNQYKVLCVDRGTTLEVERDSVRELPPRLLDTPAQAVACCLADVLPVDDQWCDSALAFFTDIVSSGTLKLTPCGLDQDSGSCRVMLRDESGDDGDGTNLPVSLEASVNRTLVELGYAEAVPGSPLDVELQVERTINDPDKLEQLETSFNELSCLRENSLGEDSDVEDGTEQDRDVEDGTEQDRDVNDKTEQDRDVNDGTEQDRDVNDGTEQDRDVNDGTEQDRDAMKASGDATSSMATESDEDNKHH